MSDRAIGIAGIVAVAAILTTLQAFRWQIVNAGQGTAMRLDRLSGRIDLCIADNVEITGFQSAELKHCDGTGRKKTD